MNTETEFEKLLLADAYREEMFEAEANGFKRMSFEQWYARRVEIAKLFKEQNRAA